MTRGNSRLTAAKDIPGTNSATDLAQLIAPLLHARGITIRQFCGALRHSTVKYEASKYLPGKPNVARIAFSSGLTRGEVAKLLKESATALGSDIDQLLAVWKEDRRFSDSSGNPADLPIFGPSKTFEHLIKLRGKGLPVRAVLDELVARELVEIHSGQTVSLRRRSASGHQGSWVEKKLLSLHVKATKNSIARGDQFKPSRRNFKRKRS